MDGARDLQPLLAGDLQVVRGLAHAFGEDLRATAGAGAEPGLAQVGEDLVTNPSADCDACLSQINAEFRPGDWDVALEVDGKAMSSRDLSKWIARAENESVQTVVFLIGSATPRSPAALPSTATNMTV